MFDWGLWAHTLLVHRAHVHLIKHFLTFSIQQHSISCAAVLESWTYWLLLINHGLLLLLVYLCFQIWGVGGAGMCFLFKGEHILTFTVN